MQPIVIYLTPPADGLTQDPTSRTIYMYSDEGLYEVRGGQTGRGQATQGQQDCEPVGDRPWSTLSLAEPHKVSNASCLKVSTLAWPSASCAHTQYRAACTWQPWVNDQGQLPSSELRHPALHRHL
jgi:hypothetical protein